MIADLLLALASVAVLLSPLVMEAGYSFELRRNKQVRKVSWDEEMTS